MIFTVGSEMYYMLQKLPPKWKREICRSKGQSHVRCRPSNYRQQRPDFQDLKFPDEVN